MATIIDSLVVKLGLDNSEFKSGTDKTKSEIGSLKSAFEGLTQSFQSALNGLATNDAFNSLGISIQNVNGGLKSTYALLGELNQKFQGMSDSEVQKIGEKMGLSKTQLDVLKKSPAEFKKLNTEIGTSSKKIHEASFAANKFFALIGGVTAIKYFVQNVIESNAELSRFATNMGNSTEKISAFQNAARVAGGSADDLKYALQAIEKAKFDVKIGQDSPMLKWLDMMRVGLADIGTGKAKQGLQVLEEINSALAKYDAPTRYQMATGAGFSAGMATMLAKDPAEFKELLAEQKKNAVTQENADKAEAARKALERGKISVESIGNKIVSSILPEAERPSQEALTDYVEKKFKVTRDQAVGIVSSLKGENATFDPSTVNSTGHVGLAQHDRTRQKKFQEIFGKPMIQSSWKEQVDFMAIENETTEKGAFEKVKAAKTAEEASAAWTKYWERTDNMEKEIPRRQKLIPYANGVATTPNASTNKQVSNTINVGGVTVNTNATNPQGIANAVTDTLQRYSYQADRSSR